MTKPRIPPADFDAAIPFLRMPADRIAAARSVLVDGKTFAAAGAPYGWTRQYIHLTVKQILVEVEKLKAYRAATAKIGSRKARNRTGKGN